MGKKTSKVQCQSLFKKPYRNIRIGILVYIIFVGIIIFPRLKNIYQSIRFRVIFYTKKKNQTFYDLFSQTIITEGSVWLWGFVFFVFLFGHFFPLLVSSKCI